MPRKSVEEFLNRIAVEDALQQQLVKLGADRGLEFTKKELTDSKPGATAERLTWKNIARFPDLNTLSSVERTAAPRHPGTVIRRDRTSMLAAASVLLCGSLTWYLWRHRQTAT